MLTENELIGVLREVDIDWHATPRTVMGPGKASGYAPRRIWSGPWIGPGAQ